MRSALALVLVLLAAAPALAQPVFEMPAGVRPARHARFDRRALVDCAEHGVWQPPEGWQTSAIEHAAIAVSPSRDALIVRARARPRLRDDATFLAQVSALAERFAGSAPTLAAVQIGSSSRWRRQRSVEGTLERGGIPYRVLGRAARSGALFVVIHRAGDTAARAAADASMASWLMLTSHACECGTDCDRRR